MKKIDLKIKDPKVKKAFFKLLKEKAKIPVCKKCGKLFPLGFPNSEAGIADKLICEESQMLCECENFEKIEEMFRAEKDGMLYISKYYKQF